MTRRERLERRAERRREWAAGRREKSDAAFEKARVVADGIPLGQPILVGHHSEKRHRKDVERIDAGMREGVESSKMAEHHEARAAGIDAQLERTIFSDDEDAVERLQEKIDAIERECAFRTRANAAFRKAKGAPGWSKALEPELPDPDARARVEEAAARLFKTCPWERLPFPSYANANARNNARRLRARLADVKARRARGEHAMATPFGVVLDKIGERYCRVTFDEKPAREVLDALRLTGFQWSQGSWTGALDALPEIVRNMLTEEGDSNAVR